MADFSFQVQETVFYLIIWAAAFSAGLYRPMGKRDTRNLRDTLNAGLVSGAMGVIAVAVYVSRSDPGTHSNFLCIGIALGVGLLGQFHDKVIRLAWKKFLAKSGLDDDEDDNDNGDCPVCPSEEQGNP